MNSVLTWIKNGNPLQYSCLKNSMDRGAWWATVHGVPNGWTWLKWLSTHTYPQKDCKNFYMNCTKPADKFRDITDIFTTLSKVFLFIFLVLLLFYQHFVLCSYQKTVLSCVWLCDPLDCSPPDFSVYGILQARILEWVAISSSNYEDFHPIPSVQFSSATPSCPTICDPMDCSRPGLPVHH